MEKKELLRVMFSLKAQHHEYARCWSRKTTRGERWLLVKANIESSKQCIKDLK